MQHSAETIQRLSKMQYDTFQMGKKIAQITCGIILIYLGFTMSSSLPVAAICMLFGCILFTGTNMPAKHRADKIIKAMDGKYPKTSYIFMDNAFEICAEEHATIRYSDLIHLGEDAGYLYLYISRTAAYMIDKSTISSLEEVMDRIANATGKEWLKAKTLSYYSIPALMKRKFRNRRKQSSLSLGNHDR